MIRRLPSFVPLLAIVGFALAAASGCGVVGESYPSKDITVVVPWGPGGNVDIVARALADATKKHLGRELSVKNVAGGAGAVGSAEVAQAKPDGYTVWHGSTGPFATAPHLSAVPYVPWDDFEPLMRVTTAVILVVVSSDSPYKTFADLIAAAKAKPDTITYGTPGEGSTNHLAGVRMGMASGTKLRAVPFASTAESVTAVIGKHIDVGLPEPGPAAQHLREGRLRALAVLEPERYQPLPDVPTAKEQGFDVVVNNWTGLALPKKTSSSIVQKLHDSYTKGLEESSFKDVITKSQLKIAYVGLEDFRKLWKQEYDMFGQLMSEAGLKKTK